MNQQLHDYLNTPIPRKLALASVIGQFVGSSVVYYINTKRLVAEANAVIVDQQESIAILNEATQFLLERADDRTATELNEKMDYWRVIRGVDR